MSIPTDPELFRIQVIEKLGQVPIDFAAKMHCIKDRQNTWEAAGVLIPLIHREPEEHLSGWRLLLIKRSSLVAQAGDLSCPGGMLDRKDALLRHFASNRIARILKGESRTYLKTRNSADIRYVTLFLATALRESWEEIHLSPFQVDFLGPLPSRSLVMFTKVIFPIVGLVRNPAGLTPNHEVEKIIEIPIEYFFNRANYARFTLETINRYDSSISEETQFPCFVQHDENGEEEILWGATFSIIMTFLKTVFDFISPESAGDILKRRLRPGYLSGSSDSNLNDRT